MTIKSTNPHDPSDVVVAFAPSGSDGVKTAVARAAEAQRNWACETAHARGTALAMIADEIAARAADLARLLVREVGKPITEAEQEIARAVAIFRYHSQTILVADGETYPPSDGSSWLLARRHPLGVCGLLTPWNFPIAIPAWKLAPAIGHGNAAVLKPAPQATAIAQMVHDIASKHVPAGIFELVVGDAETGEPLVDHADVAAISFTGSVPVGHKVAERAAGRGAKVQCEMGGQNPSIVLADADLDKAATTIAAASMGYAGQKCTATSRAIVENAVYDDFRPKLVAAIEAMEIVDPSRATCKVGPLIEGEARDTALDAITRSGGDVLTGGRALEEDGYYLAPTLIEVADRTSTVAKEEVFAPVTALMKVGSAEEGVELANDVPYGLVAAVFTTSLARTLDVSRELEAGLVRANAPTSGVDFHAPFGGTKASSIGPREQGLAARDFYTETRTLLISP